MISKYNIAYALPAEHFREVCNYRSDDPVACEEFLRELLQRGCRIVSILHEGIEMPRADFDKMIKIAAGMLASSAICASLGITRDEEHFRFGFTA